MLLSSSRSATPRNSTARNASRCSAMETRSPFSRRRPVNSMILASMCGRRAALLVEELFLVGHTGSATGLPFLEVGLQLLLGFADVALVLENGAEGVVDHRFIELVHVEESERPGPVERLADAGNLLQIQLAHPLHRVD